MEEERQHETEREGAYFCIMVALMGNAWVRRPESQKDVDFWQWQQDAMRAAVESAGCGFDEAGVSEETVAAICAEWQIEPWSEL